MCPPQFSSIQRRSENGKGDVGDMGEEGANKESRRLCEEPNVVWGIVPSQGGELVAPVSKAREQAS